MAWWLKGKVCLVQWGSRSVGPRVCPMPALPPKSLAMPAFVNILGWASSSSAGEEGVGFLTTRSE